ncbi:hypothetical protein D3C72_1898240 [compost metagenome]
MVDFNALFDFFTRFFVVDHDLACKQLGHTRGVVLDDEFLELDREWQLLQQDAIRLAENGGV